MGNACVHGNCVVHKQHPLSSAPMQPTLVTTHSLTYTPSLSVLVQTHTLSQSHTHTLGGRRLRLSAARWPTSTRAPLWARALRGPPAARSSQHCWGLTRASGGSESESVRGECSLGVPHRFTEWQWGLQQQQQPHTSNTCPLLTFPLLPPLPTPTADHLYNNNHLQQGP